MDLVLPWLVLVALVAAEAVARRREPLPEFAPEEPPPWAAWGVVAVAVAVAALRMALAVGREHHNVDELQYAATADVARRTGATLFGPRNLGAHQWLFLLGSWERPFLAVDVLTSLAVGAAGGLLGLALLRARRDAAAALLAPALLGLGLLRHEGLSSNKEPWVCLALAGWAFARLGVPPGAARTTSPPRQLAAGACLGLAAAFKEQALPFVLVEAAVVGLDALGGARAGRPRGELLAAAARDGALAALGWLLGLLPLLLGLLAHGHLGGFLATLVDFGGKGGHGAFDVVARAIGAPPPPPPPARDLADVALLTADGLLPLLLGPVGLLGLSLGLRELLEASQAPDRRCAWGLLLLALVGAAAASIGLRFFSHYLMLAVPGLAGLAALRAVELVRSVRGGRQRLTLVTLAGLALLLALLQGRLLLAYPPAAEGEGPVGEPRAALEAAGEAVRRLSPPGSTLFVWGWRPELYLVARRRPASRHVCALTAPKREALEDLRRERPPVIVVPGLRGVWASAEYDPYDLRHHPDLVAWLRAEGYEERGEVAGYALLVRGGP